MLQPCVGCVGNGKKSETGTVGLDTEAAIACNFSQYVVKLMTKRYYSQLSGSISAVNRYVSAMG